MNILDTLKYRFKNSGIVEQLIYVNLAIYLLVCILNILGFLFRLNTNLIVEWFSLPANFDDFLLKPWTIISYGFIHTSFIHIVSNLFALFYIGHLFKEYFTSKQVLIFYVLGTLFGGIIFIASYNFFPALQQVADNSILLGASAGISAIFVGSATYIPNYELKIPLIGYVKLWKLAAIWVAVDILQIPVSNAGGHLAHIGGALFGFLYVIKLTNKKLFIKKEKPLKTVYKSAKKPVSKVPEKNINEQKVNVILDKISKFGYDTLTQKEKEFLFKQGK